uniref:Tetratricopeptide repeat-containing protein n=1 Tax=Candidatus Kentrum sp. UNK TaxID=2126344 RepID=A0A451AZB5_9GAMM|nr:MAG: hypothetical protein BECKUNK1418G_GA0071005_103017 [Candidatus Kentron sp. UNK]VFK71376.1 MAG: hypothetical protein BECKUNK1418H_GA0071006_10636 [Candidatus Kentron sp. UNK]
MKIIFPHTYRHVGTYLLMVFCFLVLSSCSTVTPRTAAVFDRLTETRLDDLRTAYAEIANDANPQAEKDRAILLYHIGEQSADYDTMGDVVDKLNALHEANPNDAEITAYLGSAYTLRARDYPWQGLYQVVPGPGFVRLGYVGKGVQLLDSAVAQKGSSPAVRLVRGMTFTQLPRPFGKFDTGLDDLNRLRGWIEAKDIDTPHTGPQSFGKLDMEMGDPDPSRARGKVPNFAARYAAMLEDPAFRGEFYFRLADAYRRNGDEVNSRKFFSRAAEAASPGSPFAIAAQEMLR